ncbi:MAG TPA: hypothetical protein VJ438_01915 [Candidatus Nanoarchaeia archaeon]|nr:hypothetical protein [Candidatus Nanoarchaeia archaeon]
MNLPIIVDIEAQKIAEEGVCNMIADAPNSATRGVYSIYGDNPPESPDGPGIDYIKIYRKRW